MKGYTPNEFAKILNEYGWEFSRKNRRHHTYEKQGYEKIITVPFHKKEISRPLAQRLLKMAGIK